MPMLKEEETSCLDDYSNNYSSSCSSNYSNEELLTKTGTKTKTNSQIKVLKSKSKSNSKTIRVLFTISLLLLLFQTSSYAGTDGAELSGAYDKIVGLIGGIGGKIISIVSGVLGLTGMAVKFNPTAIYSFLGTAIGVGSLSFIVDTTVTAVMMF